MKNQYKLRITKCYLVEVIDKNGCVQEYRDRGSYIEASDYCFGSKEDAKRIGEQLIGYIENSDAE